jgi:hypothetical protein
MNRPLPPGDRGSRSGDPRGPFRCGRALSGTGGLVRRITAAETAQRIGHRCATIGPRWLGLRGLGVEAKTAVMWQGAEGIEGRSRKARRGRSRAGGKGAGGRCYLLPNPHFSPGSWQRPPFRGITEFPHNSWSQREDGLRYDRVYPIQLRIQSLRET